MKQNHLLVCAKGVSFAFTLSFFFLLTATLARGSNDTWTGGGAPDGNWGNASNWDSAPATGDFLFFDNGTGAELLTTNNLAAGTAFGGVTFNSGSGAFTLNGNGLVVTNAAQDPSSSALNGGNLANSSANGQNLNLPVTLSAGNHVLSTASGAGALNLAGAFSSGPDATVQFVKSGGNINFTGSGLVNDSSDSGGILGGWAAIGLGSNVGDWATLSGGNVAAYAGYTSKAGNASWALSSSGGDASRNIKIIDTRGTATLNSTTAGTYDFNTLLWNRGNGNPSGDETLNITSGQILRLGARGGILTVHGGSRVLNIGNGSAGTLTAGGAANNSGEISLAVFPFDDKNQRLKVNAVIADNGSGAVKVDSLGWIEIKQNSTYSGGTYITKGRAQATSVASGTQTAFGTGPIYVFPGGQVFVWDNSKANVVVTNDIYVAGYGTFEDKGGALRLTGNGISYTGKITLMGDTSIAGTATFTGKFTGTGGLTIGDNWNNGTVTLSGATPNDYKGDTTINSLTASGGNYIRIGGASFNNLMPHGAGKGNVVMTSASGSTWGEFDLNGSTQTLNGLSTGGINPGNTWIESGAPGGVLVVGDNNASSTFGGVLRNNGGTLALVKIGAGTFTLTGGQVPSAYTGSTTISNGVLALSGTGTISSPQVLISAGATLDVSPLGSFTISSGQTLAGNGIVVGAVVAGSGSIISPGFSAGTLSFSNSLSLNTGSICMLDLSSTTNGANDCIIVAGDLTLSGGTIQITAASLQTGRYKLITYGGAKTGTAAANLSLSYTGDQSISLDDSISGELDLVVSSAFVTKLTWLGDNTANVWDLAATTNWLNGATPAVFSNAVAVAFTDSGSKAPAVNIAAAVQPASLLVSNNTGTYSFAGSGGIGGGAALTKKGSGTLVLTESGDTLAGGISVQAGTLVIDNDSSGITGGATIGNGATLRVGNADANGVLPSGAVNNSGTLVFDRTDGVNVGNVISGTGTLLKKEASILTLTALNSAFTGTSVVAAGVLRGWTDSALGAPGLGNIVVSNGATLDRGWGTVGSVIVSGSGADGNGAIVDNSSGNMVGDWVGGMTTNLTLTGDTTFGGNTRWDLGNSTGASLNTGGSNYNLTINLTGGTYMEWENLTIDPNLGNINLLSPGGSLGIKGSGGSLGNPTNTITVSGTSTLTFWGDTAGNSGYAKKIHVASGGRVQFRPQANNIYYNSALILDDNANWDLFNGGGAIGTVLMQPIVLQGLVHLQIGDSLCTVSNVISGPGGFYLDNFNNTLVFTATNTYAGVTDIRSGRQLALAGNGSIAGSSNIILAAGAELSATNRVDATLTLAAGQTLNGNGTVRGNLVVSPGAIVSPGDSIGALTVTNGNVTLSGTALMEIDRDSITNDVVRATSAAASITYGGTLTVSNLNGTLVLNDSFKLFDAAAYAGQFNATNLPPLDAGLAWNWNPSSGTLSVIASVNPIPTNITTSLSGNVLTLSWPADHLGWRLQAQTNSVGAGLKTNWSDVPGSASVNSVNMTIDPANGSVFYRMAYP